MYQFRAHYLNANHNDIDPMGLTYHKIRECTMPLSPLLISTKNVNIDIQSLNFKRWVVFKSKRTKYSHFTCYEKTSAILSFQNLHAAQIVELGRFWISGQPKRWACHTVPVAIT